MVNELLIYVTVLIVVILDQPDQTTHIRWPLSDYTLP